MRPLIVAWLSRTGEFADKMNGMAPGCGVRHVVRAGVPFVFVSGSAWLMGILGCYLALRATGEAVALITAVSWLHFWPSPAAESRRLVHGLGS